MQKIIIALVALCIGSARAETPVTWNGSDKNASITVSNGGLSLSASGSGWQTARATVSRTTGKWYYENHMQNGGAYVLCGVARAAAPLNDSIGHTTDGWGYRADGLLVHVSGTAAPAYSAGDRCMVAFDADTGKLWFGKNGTWLFSGNPATGSNPTYTSVTGAIYPAASFYNSSGNPGLTANFGQTAMQYTVPTGFNSGWYMPEPEAKDLSPIFAMQAFGFTMFTLLGTVIAALFIAGIRKGYANA